jgi:hypothetical protein
MKGNTDKVEFIQGGVVQGVVTTTTTAIFILEETCTALSGFCNHYNWRWAGGSITTKKKKSMLKRRRRKGRELEFDLIRREKTSEKAIDSKHDLIIRPVPTVTNEFLMHMFVRVCAAIYIYIY